ncbi:hypothetical protein DYB25_012880 [Aphanomyces astaci]|uniref:Uncharacterized protein n=1 Tax=Aphanomyces astaci TaxID=112090 RepID=A0A397FG26_APHAT|nr:hypothetical protein DYB25_012880 [Aphanomyces astaci]RHY49670.1 hypothetical protein DYB30_010999 [Aphanomyces astaci]RHY99895.1 hypothetical protein DYB35_011743 [Aphanomyces astaci]RHZ31647.1 hypothetical protein DYB31_011483 [Aphanomyces astaci]
MTTVEKTGVVRPFGIKTGLKSATARNAALTPRRFKKFSISETWLPLKIKYATYPYHFWGLALILAIGASIFVYALSSTSNFRIKKGFWWQYVIIVLLFLFAGISFFVPRIEVFRMNHTFVTVCRPKTTRALELERKLTEVVSIGVEESGEKMGEVDTRLYSIRFDFTDGTVETLLEQCSKRVAIRRCRSLNFLLAAYTPGSPLKPNKANANSVDLSPAVVT